MKHSGVFVSVCLCLLPGAARAADATTPVDYTQRNAPFAPAPTVSAERQTPQRNDAVQDKRVEIAPFAKQPAAIGDRRAAIDVTETRGKTVREKDSHRPEAVEQPISAFNRREAAITTAGDTKKPPLVSKYQETLTAASATPTRLAALEGATAAKINRFVFRKNGAEPAASPAGAPVTPAAGGGSVLK